jgi:hypothetical protein
VCVRESEQRARACSVYRQAYVRASVREQGDRAYGSYRREIYLHMVQPDSAGYTIGRVSKFSNTSLSNFSFSPSFGSSFCGGPIISVQSSFHHTY